MSHGVPSVRGYLAVFFALLVLTVVTVWAAYQDFGAFNDVVAMAIASTKATLVVLFFMHLRHSTKLAQISIVASLAFFGLLIAVVMADIYTRGVFGASTELVPRP